MKSPGGKLPRGFFFFCALGCIIYLLAEEIVMRFVIGIDPGRSKIGIAVITSDGELLQRNIVTRYDAVREVTRMPFLGQSVIALGDGTEARAIADELRDTGEIPQGCRIAMVDEKDSTTEGRMLFLASNRGNWLTRLIPLGLRVPGRPWDDYVAEVIARRGLKQILESDVNEG